MYRVSQTGRMQTVDPVTWDPILLKGIGRALKGSTCWIFPAGLGKVRCSRLRVAEGAPLCERIIWLSSFDFRVWRFVSCLVELYGFSVNGGPGPGVERYRM